MAYDYNEVIVTINGKDYSLNWEQTKQIREQFGIQDAVSVLEAYGNIDIENIDRDTLLELAYDLEDALSEDTGDIEYSIVEGYLEEGLIAYKED